MIDWTLETYKSHISLVSSVWIWLQDGKKIFFPLLSYSLPIWF